MRQLDFCDEKDTAEPLVQKRISIDHNCWANLAIGRLKVKEEWGASSRLEKRCALATATGLC
jgi:hypothetical protein